MARAALYKWIKSTDLIDREELDKMIQRYPFAQNLQVLKSLDNPSDRNKILGQANSLQTSWFQYVLNLEQGKKLTIEKNEESTISVQELIEEVMPTHVSDGENMTLTDSDSDQKLIVYDLPEEASVEIEEEIVSNKTEPEVNTLSDVEPILEEDIEESLHLDLSSKLEGDEVLSFNIESKKQIEQILDVEEDNVDLEQSEVEAEIVVIEARLVEEVVEDILDVQDKNTLSDNSEEIVSEINNLEKESEFVSWLKKLNPTNPPAAQIVNMEVNKSEIDIKELDESTESAAVEVAEEAQVITPANDDHFSEESEDGQMNAKKKSSKKSKSKNTKKNKKKIKLKREKKNKKLSQKLRKKKKENKLKASKKAKKKLSEKTTIAKLRAQNKALQAKLKAIENPEKKKSKKSGKLKLKLITSEKEVKDSQDDSNKEVFINTRSREKRRKKKGLDMRLASEPLANLLWLQGHRKKAIKMFDGLSLKMPEKKAYFAAQIEKLKNKKK